MPNKPPILSLTFSRRPKAKLRRSVLELNGVKLKKAECGTYKQFFWRQGAMAICLFWIRYVLHYGTKGADPKNFVFAGPRQHPAKTLWELLDNSTTNVPWLLEMYGKPESEGKTRLHEYISSTRVDKHTAAVSFELRVNTDMFPPESVIFFDHDSGKQITKAPELEQLAESIEKQWYATARNGKRVDADSTPSQADKNISAQATNSVVGDGAPSSQAEARGSNSLADYFRSLPIESINRYIVAALRSPPATNVVRSDLVDQFLEPATLTCLTEKVARAPLESFVDFYLSDHNSLPEIKRAVASAIASSRDLRIAVANNAVNCGPKDLIGWIQAFSFFCPHEIAIEVEHAFNTFGRTQDSQAAYTVASLDDFLSIMRFFHKHGCVGAIHTLANLWFEQLTRDEYAITPAANLVKEFAALIGQEQFRSKCENSILAKQNPDFFRHLLKLVPATRRRRP